MEEEMTTIKREIQNLKRPKTPIKKGCMWHCPVSMRVFATQKSRS